MFFRQRLGEFLTRKLALGLLFLLLIGGALAQERPRLVAQTGHTGNINAVAFSRDGKTALSGGNDKMLCLWDVASGRELKTLSGHTDWVLAVAISPDGKTLLSGSRDKTLRVWDVASGRELKTLNAHTGRVNAVAFSPDGRTVISGSIEDHTMRLWDAASGRQLKNLSGYTKWVNAVAFSPDGKTVLSGSWDNTLRLWDVASGRELKALSGHTSYVNAVAFSPDGKTALSGSWDKTLRLWDVASGRELKTLSGHTSQVNAVAFSPDGKTVLSGSDDKSLRLWNVASGRELTSLNGHSGRVNAVAFSPDGNAGLSGSWDGTLRLWDVTSGRELKSLNGHSRRVYSVAFSPDGKTLLSGSGDNTLRLWDVTSSSELKTLNGHSERVNVVAFSPDGKTVLSGGGDKTLRLWDVTSGRELKNLSGFTDWVGAAAFSPDGKTALSEGAKNTLRLWDVTSGRELKSLSGHTNFVNAAAFSPDGKTALSGGDDKTLRLWDLASGRELKTLSGHTSYVSAVAFSPDGKTLVSGSGDKTLRLWEVASGRELKTLSGHTSFVTSVAFSPDGNTLLSGSGDTRMKLWRVSDGTELATLVSFTDGTWVVTDPEGRFDTADLESMPHLHWVMPDDPFTPVPLEAFMKDYYEPRLLARILAGETFKPVRALTSLNRTQPEVKIVSVVPEGADPSLVRVTVSAAGATKSYLQGEGAVSKEVPRSTAVHDLRLFRDGQVVGYADGKLAEFAPSGSAFTKTFTVRLPGAKAGQDVVFSAYAFNEDRVKSETVRSTYKAPALPSAVASTQGRAYVISMGVNQHENNAWNLGYAANDARAVAQRVSADLRKSAQYAEVVPLVLASDGEKQQASKAALRAVLASLAGQPVSPADEAALQGVAGAELLRKAQPDDLVLISFAGHGFADDAGQFYLLPQDTGAGSSKQITEALKAHSIGSEELSLWLRDVDAGDMTMIVDACQSAASVQAEGFKPGPMGSRGLGQLSFDKGMRILAASQSDEYALEDQRLRHGLLTFSLINDGLEAFNADHEPKDSKVWLDEWLRYGVKRVPALADEVKSGTVKVANRGPERGAVRVNVPDASGKPSAAARPAQQPALFDFARKRQTVVLASP